MEKIVKQENGQWSISDDAVEKSVEDDIKIADIKRRNATPKIKSTDRRIAEIKEANTLPKELPFKDQVSRVKRKYESALELSASQSEDEELLEKTRYAMPRGTNHGFDMPTNPDVGQWEVKHPATSTHNQNGTVNTPVQRNNPATNKPETVDYTSPRLLNRVPGRSFEAPGHSQVASTEQLKAILGKRPDFNRLSESGQSRYIEGMQNMNRAHEVQHDIVGHLAGQVKHIGHHDPTNTSSAPLSSYLLANANLSPHESHLLDTSLRAGGRYNMQDHPEEAIAHVAQWLNSGREMRENTQWPAIRQHMPGESYFGYVQRLKGIQDKLTNTMSRLRRGQEVSIPSKEEYSKSIHGAGTPNTNLKSNYEPYSYKPVKKSISLSVAAGLQPSSEQWEAAAAQMLGLPTTAVEAERLGKMADAQWDSVIADSFKSFQVPVEKQPQTNDFGRGRVNQNDESTLTEEERRIRAIPVDPSVFNS